MNSSDSINEQGGGLIDVGAAVNTKAIMGVTGDGITAPGILGSHSFGEKAVLNNRINNTFKVPVTIRDVSGQGGTYSLSTVNNRLTDIAGVSTAVSQSSVNVPANGSATFNATISIDGDVIRSTDIKQFQWYVVAENGGKKLRAPMYLQATPSLPSDQIGSSVTNIYNGTVLASDGGAQRDNDIYLLEGATYVDVPFTLDASTLKLDASLTWDFIAASPERAREFPTSISFFMIRTEIRSEVPATAIRTNGFRQIRRFREPISTAFTVGQTVRRIFKLTASNFAADLPR